MLVKANILEAFRSALRVDGPLTLLGVEIFHGPNPYCDYGAALCRLEATNVPVTARALRDRLETAFPGCIDAVRPRPKASADTSTVSDLVARLAAGLLRAEVGLEPFHGSCAADGHAVCWVEHSSINAGLQSLKTALAIVARALESEEAGTEAFAAGLQTLKRACQLRRPNFDAAIMIAAARRRAIPYSRVGQHASVWQFGWGNRSERFWVTASNADGMVAQRVSRDKELAKRFMRQLGIPTPQSRVLGEGEDFRPAVKAIGWPCVVKPVTGGAGRGVSANLMDMVSAERAVAVAREIHPTLLIEEHVRGEDYRLMVIDGELVAAVKRTPPSVIGDGKSSIEELISSFNELRQRGDECSKFLEPVSVDGALLAAIASQGADLRSVPSKGEQILLRTSSNRSVGGTCEDVTSLVHPQIREMAVHLTGAFGFRATGIDYVTPDISKSFGEVGGGVLEINTTPGTRVLLAGGLDPDKLGAQLLGSRPGRIPVALIVAPKDSLNSIETELADRLPMNHGLATSTMARIGDFPLPNSPDDVPARSMILLCHPTVERLIILWTAEELYASGLPVDRLETAIVVGSEINQAWLELLRRTTRQLHMEKSARKAVARALQ
jgi:cyanophycin synthetase